MHAQLVNVLGIIKEMGIRILDGVNEIRPDEKKIHLTFSKRAVYRCQREPRKKLAGAYCQTSVESCLTI